MPEVERHILKEGNAFYVMDPRGDLPSGGGFGLYLEDTRHLARHALSVDGSGLRLARTEAPTTYAAYVDLLQDEGGRRDAFLHVRREILLSSCLGERLRVLNLTAQGRRVELVLTFAVDFRDMFEVRGVVPRQRRIPKVELTQDGILWWRRGRDGVLRWTRVRFRPPPGQLDRGSATWLLSLGSRDSTSLTLAFDFGMGNEPEGAPMETLETLERAARRRHTEEVRRWPGLEVDHENLAAWLGRSLHDAVALLITVRGHRVPAAGLPWYGTFFGRDSLIFGLETVPLRPRFSQEILRCLAKLQGQRDDPRRAEAPGKIPHELQRGELAGSGQIPFDPYYGTVDASPLFLCLLSEVYRWTGDRRFCEALYPAATAAATYIRQRMEGDSNGFLCYVGGEPPALRHHGWKDSEHAVLHPDGSQPAPPIALCEVQGYVYWGLLGLAEITAALHHEGEARQLEIEAERLRKRFDAAFWMPSQDTYALAVDGEGEQVKVMTSNPGHLLMCDVLPRGRAERVVRRLMGDDCHTGWGLRTMAESASFYHPLSYHHGSVWPHDTALIAWGMSRRGFQEEASRLFEDLLAAARGFRYRLPELFGGFAREGERGPLPVSRACDLQAWVAGAPFLMLRGLLGLEADVPSHRLRVKPFLPADVHHIEFHSLRLGGTTLDLRVEGEGTECAVTVPRTAGAEIEVRPEF